LADRVDQVTEQRSRIIFAVHTLGAVQHGILSHAQNIQRIADTCRGM